MTEVEKFVKEVQRMIDEEGLKGISGTNFEKVIQSIVCLLLSSMKQDSTLEGLAPRLE